MSVCKFAGAMLALAGFAEAELRSGSVSYEYLGTYYGKFVTRMKLPNKKGTVATFSTRNQRSIPEEFSEINFEITPDNVNNPVSTQMMYSDYAT